MPADQQVAPPAGDLHLATSSQRIPELDGLRGLAILLVLICHYISDSQASNLPFLLRRFVRALAIGWSGVDLFFVLSGFLIGGILLESKNSQRYFRTFYMRRVHRILPVYYAWIFLYILIVVCLYVATRGTLGRLADFAPVPYYFLFIQNFFFNKEHIELVWFGATWSLAVEEQFYLCAPLLIRQLSRDRLLKVLAAVIFFAPALRLLLLIFAGEYKYLATFSMFSRSDALAMGMLAAAAWQDPRFRSFLKEHPEVLTKIVLSLLVVLAALLYWLERPVGLVLGTIGYTSLAALYLSVLLFALSYPGSWFASSMRFKPLRALGTISYCVYIIHYPVLAGLHQLLLHAYPRIDDAKGVAVTLLAFAITLGLAGISWRLYEKPLIRRGHRYVY